MSRTQPRLFVSGLEKDIRATPQELFDRLNAEFGFTLDTCALPENAKCSAYFTPDMDGLQQEWAPHVCWYNPPYSEIRDWAEKALHESKKGATVVMLLPAATDTAWFHDLALPFADVRFLRGRLKFGGNPNPAPFGSVLVIFKGRQEAA